MKKRTCIGLIIAVILSILVIGIVAGQSMQSTSSPPPATLPWVMKTVDAPSGGTAGQYNSVALSPETGKPYISYYDATHSELRLSYPVASSGNCGPNNSWSCEVVDTSGNVGQDNAVDYYYNSSTGTRKIGISYYDATNQALKVAVWSCGSHFCTWHISTIQTTAGNTFSSTGFNTSLKFDSTGAIHISYQTRNLFADEVLMYAHSVNSGGNCGVGTAAGKWQCDSVTTDPDAGEHTSLAVSADDSIWIASFDSSSGSTGTGVVSICTWTGSLWYCTNIAYVDGGFPALSVDGNNHAYLAYYDAANGTLKAAEFVGAGDATANCGYNSVPQYTYRCDVIDDSIGSGVNQMGIDLAVDADGHPLIAYEDASDLFGISVLNIARPIDAYGQISGNCGPQVGILHQWQCDTLDNATEGGGGGHLHEADYVSTAVNSAGLVFVSYYEYDDYNDEGEGRLKVIYQQHTVFLPMIVK